MLCSPSWFCLITCGWRPGPLISTILNILWQTTTYTTLITHSNHKNGDSLDITEHEHLRTSIEIFPAPDLIYYTLYNKLQHVSQLQLSLVCIMTKFSIQVNGWIFFGHWSIFVQNKCQPQPNSMVAIFRVRKNYTGSTFDLILFYEKNGYHCIWMYGYKFYGIKV